MSKRASRLTRKEQRTSLDPKRLAIEQAAGKVGLSSADLGKGLNPDQLKTFAQSLATQGVPGILAGMQKREPAQPSVVSSYIEALGFFQVQASSGDSHGFGPPSFGLNSRTTTQHARQYWATLRDARIIEISPKLYTDIHHEVDVFTTEKIGGESWTDKIVSEAKARVVGEKVNKAANEIPFPPKLPFPSVYLGLAEPVGFPPDSGSFQIRALGAFKGNFEQTAARMTVLGYLVSDGLCILEFLRVEDTEGRTYLTAYSVWADPGGWGVPNTGLPWTINILIDFINSHQSLVLEKHGWDSQRRWKKQHRALNIKRPIPPPYYTVHIRDQVIEEKLAGLRGAKKHTFSFSHRHDVRAHEAIRICRGPLPIPDKLRKRFGDNPARRLYVTEKLRAEDAERLAKRGIPPKRADEWMSILVTDVRAHIRPLDPKLPYIPAIRKLPERSDHP
jgi:hypothetical protein